MKSKYLDIATRYFFYLAIALIVYMPLHVFIAQSASLLTGGIEVWKAAKDVLIVILVPLMLCLSYRKGLFKNKTFRWLIILGAIYTAIHMLFVIFDQNDDTYSAIVGSVYNTRLLGYLLLGYLVGSAKNGAKYLKYLLTAAVLIASAVSLFGVLQYFLPSDLLTHVGYSTERGVKYLFFIDDRPELPRVMSTLKDPNSLGAYLILPMLLTGFALIKRKVNENLFVRPFRRGVLAVMLAVQAGALFLSFSRGALLGLGISIVTLLFIVMGEKAWSLLKKFWYVPLILLSIFTVSIIAMRNSSFVQDYILHAAVSTNEQDPNEKRLTLYEEAIEDIVDEPEGYGPGSAGLVSITNPQGGLLTENYYLQIAYEVGWLGLALLVAILSIVTVKLLKLSQKKETKVIAGVMLASLAAYLFYSLLIHLWSNEAVSLQWWLLTGAVLGVAVQKVVHVKH